VSEKQKIILRWVLLVLMVHVVVLLFDTELRFFYEAF